MTSQLSLKSIATYLPIQMCGHTHGRSTDSSSISSHTLMHSLGVPYLIHRSNFNIGQPANLVYTTLVGIHKPMYGASSSISKANLSSARRICPQKPVASPNHQWMNGNITYTLWQSNMAAWKIVYIYKYIYICNYIYIYIYLNGVENMRKYENSMVTSNSYGNPPCFLGQSSK